MTQEGLGSLRTELGRKNLRQQVDEMTRKHLAAAEGVEGGETAGGIMTRIQDRMKNIQKMNLRDAFEKICSKGVARSPP